MRVFSDQKCKTCVDLQSQQLCFAFSLPHHWMHLARLQGWSTTLLEEMEHYVFCGRLSYHHSGFTIPWTMAVYTQRCLICHSVEVCVYVCVFVDGRVTAHAHWKPTTPSPLPATPKAPIYSAHLRKSWCSHNSGLNECCSRRELLLNAAAVGRAAAATHVFTILSADRESGAGGGR